MVANPSLGAGWFDLVEKNEGKAAVLWAEANNRRSKRTKRIASSDEFDPSPLQIAFFRFSWVFLFSCCGLFFDASIELDQDTIPNPAQSRLVTSDDGRTPKD